MFLFNECKFLETFGTEQDASDHFPQFIIKYLEDNHRLHTIQNRVYIHIII